MESDKKDDDIQQEKSKSESLGTKVSKLESLGTKVSKLESLGTKVSKTESLGTKVSKTDDNQTFVCDRFRFNYYPVTPLVGCLTCGLETFEICRRCRFITCKQCYLKYHLSRAKL